LRGFLAVGAGVLGGALGGVLGAIAFDYLLSQGIYAIVLPGVLIGMGSGLAMQRRNAVVGLLCAIAAGALTILLEWKHFPFVADHSLSYFVQHLHELKPTKLGLFALSIGLAYWFGVGRQSLEEEHA
jgi:hypothetical protein